MENNSGKKFNRVNRVNREILTIKTGKIEEIVDITDKINAIVSSHKEEGGVVLLFLMHTTAALVTAALDPKTDLDILDALEMTVPAYYSHLHHHARVPHHVVASFLSASQVIPVEKHRLMLGEMQRIMLVEFNGPKERTIVMDFIN
jgi:secondary thiamine-phosphate synthase enzyme